MEESSNIETKENKPQIFSVRTTAGREEQVIEFASEIIKKKGYDVYSLVHPNGMKGYIFIEAGSLQAAEEAMRGVPYAKGVIPSPIAFDEIEHMVQIEKKQEVNIKIGDIVEIISGPFQREQAKVIRTDLNKEDVVVELINAAVPIPITLKVDNVKVIRREQ
ncbi:MAG: transcription termination/antitermination protein NusG [Candidatus Woesearchaeota archaeon]|nr:transcription termination/antitermination protein NusG [Candidatus Woesearchaeota archaeon]MDN5327605.1 transcription termination/antitermination protein NusG [Candidatus Woesearchaeota archaeon]